MAPSRQLAARSNEARGEMKDALDGMKRHGVVRASFPDAGREDKAKDSGTRFFVGAHGPKQCRWRNARPRWQRSQQANQRHDAGNIVSARQTELVAKKSSRDRSEERREGKSVEHGGRRNIKKKKKRRKE